ncbi:hypothetical protein SAMN04487898_12031 [Pedobacter sp. ok626]|uniref:hypothetical protein n=1 Tax=Pedobacter sp. ok626 TaxID=1761882 RepID=UPI0008898E8B|nr:hypothetical protein [Pedobacter sp. ok626]SDL52927.1 hypothetical protein SAMN04487898_12031 [Pedobacter sp. ok626]
MKRILLLMLLGMCALSNSAEAQESTSRAQNVFVEIGGQGILFSANYDTRFGNRRDGLGGRVGIGYVAIDGTSVTTIPVSLNYLLGKGKNFFEIGLGTTYGSAKLGDDFLSDDDNNESGSAFIGTMSFMYRLQPVDSGFALRAGFTPVFTSNYFIPYYVGVSLGYTF